MYLKSLKIENFRKFGNKNNIVEFVDSRKSLATTDDINVAKATSLIVGKNNAGKTTIITALDKIVNSQKFNANDFNFIYLSRLLNMYKHNHYIVKPNLYFELIIGIDERNGKNSFSNTANGICLRGGVKSVFNMRDSRSVNCSGGNIGNSLIYDLQNPFSHIQLMVGSTHQRGFGS